MATTFKRALRILQNSINKKLKAIFNGSESGKSITKEDSSKPTAINEAIANTPFRLAGDPDKGYMIICGKYGMTPTMPTRQEAIDWFNEHEWDVTANLIIVMPSIIKEAEELKTFTEQKMDKEHNAL